nr:uncharacterized protein LOC109162048 [Ipomoea batatas]
MGTQVQNKDHFPVYHHMRDLNGNASSNNWPFYYSDRTLTNGQYCNGFMPMTITDANSDYEKDAVKQKMIEHEAVFKNQVSELHRLYRIQRDMMEDAKRRELNKHWMPMEPSSSSSILGSQMPSEYAWKWQNTCFPFVNSGYARPAASSTDIVNSPLSCTKGSDIQSGRIPFQNGYSSKHYEVLDSRPSKVCKKLFDLELPAYKYIDTEEGEHLHDSKESFHPGNSKNTQESSVKLFLDGHGATDYRKDALTSNLCLRSGNKLADLNEPAQLDEATTQSPVSLFSHDTNHTEAKSSSVIGKSTPLLASSREGIQNCHYGNGFLSNLSAESQGKQRGLLPYTYEAGHVKKNQSQAIEGLEKNKLHMHCHPAEGIQGRAQQHPGIHQTHGIRGDMWRGKTGCGLPTFEKNHDNSNNSCVEPLATSVFSTSHTLANSSQFVNSCSHSVSAWGKSTNSVTQKVASFHKSPCLNSSTSLEMRLSENTHTSIGDNINGSSRDMNPGLSSDVLLRNGFAHGSSRLRDQSTCLPSNFLNNMKNSRSDYMSSARSTNHWHDEKLLVSSNFMDSKSTKGLDLNEAIGKEDEELVDNKDKLGDSASILCWLKDKPVCKNTGRIPNSDFGFTQSSPNPPFCQSNNSKHANEAFSQSITFSERTMEAKEVGETPCAKKILGVPILEIPFASKHESSSRISTSATICSSAEGELLRNEKKCMIDINVACDLSIDESDEMAVPEPLFTGKGLDSEPAGMRNHFDLNSCITEEDDALGPSVASDNVKTRAILDIDLEAPVVLDSEEDNPPTQENNQHETSLQLPEHKTKKADDEVTWIAAETIVAMSSGQCNPTENTRENPSEDPFAETLLWFVDVVSSFADELKLNSGKEIRGKGGVLNEQHFSYEGIDYFEAMTLQLTETKEEEYMPKPFIPEAQNMEDAGEHLAPTRTRRGQARRGRQRRDFQRDILPSLTSLSRHEVSEDFQTFGRLMSPQACGFTRRNGTRSLGARGRRRIMVVETEPAVVSNPVTTSLLQQLNKGGLEDKSLTGWGKRTRRPRRQRCPPAANPPIATVT